MSSRLKIFELLLSDENFNDMLSSAVTSLLQSCEESPLEGIAPDILVFEPTVGLESKFGLTVLQIRSGNFDEDKYEIIETIGNNCRERSMKPVATFMAGEAWMKSMTEEESRERKGRSLSTYEDKTEIAFLAGMTIDGRTNMAVMNITRTESDSICLSVPHFMPYMAGEKRTESDLLKAFYRGYFENLNPMDLKSFFN